MAALALAGGGLFLATRGDDTVGSAFAAAPAVGGDLHTVTAVGDARYVGGHAAVAVSRAAAAAGRRFPGWCGCDGVGGDF